MTRAIKRATVDYSVLTCQTLEAPHIHDALTHQRNFPAKRHCFKHAGVGRSL